MTRKFLLTLFLLAAALSGIAQSRKLAGVVKDGTSREPLPGVSVLLAGTNSGTITDAEGKFILNVPASGGSVVVSYVGFEKQTIEIGNRTSLEVSLGPDVKALE